MAWLAFLKDVLRCLGLRRIGLGVTVSLPSFYKNEEDMQQSRPTDWSADDVPDVAVSRDYRHASQELIKRFSLIATEFSQLFPGKTLMVTTTYRSPKEQNRLYQLGRKGNEIIDHSKVVTNCNGITTLSDHNKFPSRALDVAVLNGGKITWTETEYYPIGPLSKKHGLEWGGFWTRAKPDYPHLYLPKDVA